LVKWIKISNGKLTASVLSYGALLQDLRCDGHDFPLVLGLNSLADYEAHSPAFGIIPGRFANRIAGGKFQLDGKTFNTDVNFMDRHTLHGGKNGFGKQNWQVEHCDGNSVTLTLMSPDGEMGFPGNMDARVRYLLTANNALRIELGAKTDKPTVCNLTHHSYFNLSGEETILDHQVQLDAASIVATDDELIPTGELAPTSGSDHDFTSLRPIRLMRDGAPVKYDDNFCLSDRRVPLRDVGKLTSPTSGIEMTLATTEPGVQLYTGSKVSVPVAGLDGRKYGAFAGVCLETQEWPDAPNQPSFPSSRLDPGENYNHVVEYQFNC
jgi:aldose 1-epimerase